MFVLLVPTGYQIPDSGGEGEGKVTARLQGLPL